MSDTIFALASGQGRAGVGVVRVSGPDAGTLLDGLVRVRPKPRQAGLRRLQCQGGPVLDEALVLWFPGPGSFTGEDSVEFHLHGGPAIFEAVFAALSALGGRPAEPGEFSRRAFANGKMDLTEAEGLADLIDAETEAQRAQALAQMSGSLRTLYDGWRERLISVLAALEGEIDFPDEDDVPDALSGVAAEPLRTLIAALEEHLDDSGRGERVRDGFSIALIGAPNAGKSSLLNALAGREAAIVTDIPGTTRDIVEVRLVLNGFAVIVADTAGVRETADQIEAEGVKRALARAEDADLRLALVDVSRETSSATVLDRLEHDDAIVYTKSDLNRAVESVSGDHHSFYISVRTGEGLNALEAWLREVVSQRLGAREAPALSRARHRDGVQRALMHLARAHHGLEGPPELVSADVHLALRSIEGLTGRIDVEDVLDRVFSQFCIGK